mgnify:CR=1 FL=1
MTDDNTLHIHESVFDDAAFKITCDLLDRGMLPNDQVNPDAVVAVIKQALRHQLYLQRNWDDHYEGLPTKQLWSRPVQA